MKKLILLMAACSELNCSPSTHLLKKKKKDIFEVRTQYLRMLSYLELGGDQVKMRSLG